MIKRLRDYFYKQINKNKSPWYMNKHGESQADIRNSFMKIEHLFKLDYDEVLLGIGQTFARNGFCVELRNAPEGNGKGCFFVLRKSNLILVVRFVYSPSPLASISNCKLENLIKLCADLRADEGLLLERGIVPKDAYIINDKYGVRILDGLDLAPVLTNQEARNLNAWLCPCCGSAMRLKSDFEKSGFFAWVCSKGGNRSGGCDHEPFWANFPGPTGEMLLAPPNSRI